MHQPDESRRHNGKRKGSRTQKGNSPGNHSNRLTIMIVGSIVAAIVMALVLPGVAVHLKVGGDVFLRLLQMVVVPLVMASVMSGILGLGDVRKLGRPGAYAVLYYLSTTVLAVLTGLAVVNLINPGVGIDKELVEDARREGQAEVSAIDAGRGPGVDFWWENGLLLRQNQAAVSDPLTLPEDHQQQIVARVIQVGHAERPAELTFTWSADGKQFQTLQEPVRVESSPGTHVVKKLLPAEAKFARVEFAPQAGGTSSVVSAEVIRGPPAIYEILENLVLMLFTDNLLGSMVEINLLPVIVFSIVFAGMLTTMGARAKTVNDLVISVNDALMNFILLLMNLAPLGIFCLVASRFAKAQLDGQLQQLLGVQAKYMLTVLSGLGIHALITLPLILWLFTRRNPLRFIAQMSQAVLTAFSTSSSTATLPVTMECAEHNAGVSRRSTEFVLPLGATINMDGTALYEAAAAIFIAQAYAVLNPEAGITGVQQVTIALTATLAAIGAAGIPEAGLVTLLIVLNAAGLPLELIGLILPVDWLLDRFRTAVNVVGDSVGCAVVDGSFPPDAPAAGVDEPAAPGPPLASQPAGDGKAPQNAPSAERKST